MNSGYNFYIGITANTGITVNTGKHTAWYHW